jgi:hypothetical protein
LFSRFSLVTGETGSSVLHLGLDETAPPRGPQHWRAQLKSYMVPGLGEIRFHVAAVARGPARENYEKALREVAGEHEVIVEECE